MKKGPVLLIPAVAILGTAFLLPNFASAESSLTLPVNLNVPSQLSLSASEGSIDLTGTAGSFVSDSTTLTAFTNNHMGYTITMNTDTDNNALVHFDSNVTDTVSSITGTNVPSANFTDNTWGYSTDGTNYNKIPTLSSVATISASDKPGTNDISLYFGSKFNTAITSGNYSNTLIISMTANPEPIPTISQLTNMQEMTPESCAASAENETAQLKDTRDNSTYTVAKLADNNCWMTQNLRLGDSSKSYSLDSTNSDLQGSQTFTIPIAQTSGSDSWSCSDDTACQTARVYATGNESYGNYYTWYTATANTGTKSMSSGNATGSICPKGWRLPTVDPSDTTNGEFYKMVAPYINSGTWSSTYWKSVTTTDFTNVPLSLVFSGGYLAGVGGQGGYGDWWSSTVYSSSSAYGLYVVSNGYVYPANSNSKYYGNSVRCVVSVS